MNLIQKQPNSSGAYPPIHSRDISTPPEEYYEIACDCNEFYNGFITPTVENGVVTSFVCNTSAWEAWKAWVIANPPPTPEPTVEEKQAEQIRAQNATIAVISSAMNDILSDLEALRA